MLNDAAAGAYARASQESARVLISLPLAVDARLKMHVPDDANFRDVMMSLLTVTFGSNCRGSAAIVTCLRDSGEVMSPGRNQDK
jgi:hypothetical protein